MTREIEARHQKEPDEFRGAVGYPSCAGCTGNWPCDTAIVLAQLAEAREERDVAQETVVALSSVAQERDEAREKLAAAEEYASEMDRDDCVLELLRILEGGK